MKTSYKVSKFQRGCSTYVCLDCGKRTRETGECESGVELCADCYEKAGDENLVADGAMTREQFDAKWN